LLKHALQRLRGVNITTNIATGEIRRQKGFGLIDTWEIIERSPTDQRMVGLELKLSDWFYNAVINYEVLNLLYL